MIAKNIIPLFFILLALIWSVSGLKNAASRLPLKEYNEAVIVEVVELPLCGRSNIIKVKYQEKKYSMSINKNDCIQGVYPIGAKLEAIYNPKIDEINPLGFLGVYRIRLAVFILVGLIFIIYLVSTFRKNSKPIRK